MRVMSPQIGWFFVLFFPSGKCKKHELLLYPPPRRPFAFERTFCGYFVGVQILAGLWLIFERLAQTVSKLSHATAGQIFISRSEFFGVFRPTKEIEGGRQSKTNFPPRTPKNEKIFIYFANKLLLRNIKFKEPDKNCTSVESFKKWALSYFLPL